MTKHALITGHLGFVGRHLGSRLLAEGWEISGCDIKEGRSGECRRIFAGDHRFDLVIHCAAIVGGRARIDGQPMEVATDLAIDSDFFQFVLRTRPTRSVYFSSSAAYPIRYQTGSPPWRLGESEILFDHAEEPDAIYGWVKLTGERLAVEANKMGANIQVYRPFSGYGSDQDLDYPFPSIIDRAIRGDDPFVIWGPGTQIRDWIHVDDVVDKVIAGLDYDEQFGPTNLCTGTGTAMLHLAALAWELRGHGDDDRLTFDVHPEKPTGVQNRVGDPTKMVETLGATQIDLHEGVLRAIRRRVTAHDR